jgi:hypothetical protein
MIRFKIFHDVPENAEMALNQFADAQPDDSELVGMEITAAENGKVVIVIAYETTKG